MLPMFPICKSSVRLERIGDQIVVHDESRDYVHVFGRTESEVLGLCDGLHTCDEIVQSVAQLTHQGYTDAAGEVAHIVGTFADLALIVSASLATPQMIA